MWLEVFRKEKASNGGLKLSRQAAAVDSFKRKPIRDPSSGKPPLHTFHGALEHKGSLQDSASTASHLPLNANVKKVNGKAIKIEAVNSSKLEINSSRSRGSTGRPDTKLEMNDFAMTEAERAAIAAAEAARAAALAAAEVCRSSYSSQCSGKYYCFSHLQISLSLSLPSFLPLPLPLASLCAFRSIGIQLLTYCCTL